MHAIPGMVIPSLVAILYVGLFIYFILLATRFVRAAERIASCCERYVADMVHQKRS